MILIGIYDNLKLTIFYNDTNRIISQYDKTISHVLINKGINNKGEHIFNIRQIENISE